MWLTNILKFDFKKVFQATFKEFFDDDLDQYAAAVAFKMLFSVIPFLILFLAIISFLNLQELYEIMQGQAEAIVPGEATDLVSQIIGEMDLPAGRFLPLALLVALWLASSAMRSATHALNIAYQVDETRSFKSQFVLSIVYTLAIVFMMILAMILLITGTQAVEWLAGQVGLDNVFVTVWAWLRWPVAVTLIMITIAFIYAVAPNIKQSYYNMIPGAVLAVLVWIGLSIGFDFYMRTFIDLSILFGGLGAIIFLMIYFYICAAVLLFGAKLNEVIKRGSLSN
ncbi:MAG: YihY/virulence factor BrkB family protein [Balneolaceae bacterium]|nr:YihY/virulence factor BrkB family protein [Balneolaceae bacterium]